MLVGLTWYDDELTCEECLLYGFWLGRYCGGLLYQLGGFWPRPAKPPGGLPVPLGLKNGIEPKTNGG